MTSPLVPRPRCLWVGGVALSALLGGAVAGCQAKPPAPLQRPLAVQAVPVAQAVFSQNVDTVSTLEAIDEVALAAQATGRIEQLLVRQGDAVSQGQRLLVLDQVQLRAEVEALRAQTETDRINYARFEQLARVGADTALRRDQARQQYISSRQALVARQADLQFRDLKAPIAGVVGDLQVKQGDVLQAGSPFTTIIRNDRLLARVDVPAVFSDRVRLGQPVILMDPATGAPLAQGQVRSIDPGVVASTQSLLVKAEFPNPRGELRTGLRTRTRLVLDTQQQLAVPFAAVTQVAGQSFVFVAGGLEQLRTNPGRLEAARLAALPADGRFALQVPVKLGPLQDNRYPVLSGLTAGQQVITTNLLNLRHGSPVQVN
jgi:RND family efflux transporter MFP subunit